MNKLDGNDLIELNKGISNASLIINKDYLNSLATYNIKNMIVDMESIDICDCASFYKMNTLVLNKDENFLKKLATVISVVSSTKSSLCTIIDSNGDSIDFYLGIIFKDLKKNDSENEKKRIANSDAFKGSIEGNFIGSDLDELDKDSKNLLKENVLGNKRSYFSSISGVASLRRKDTDDIKGYIQGIENLVDSLKGKKYTIVMIADSVSNSDLTDIRSGYEILYSQLSHLSEVGVTMVESETRSMTDSRTESISNSITKGISLTQGNSVSDSSFSSNSLGAGFGFLFSANSSRSSGRTVGNTSSYSRSDSSSRSSQRGQSMTSSKTSAETSGRSIQVSYEDRRIKSLLDKIDKNIERLDECESYGAFNTASYIITDDMSTNITVASNYSSLMRGDKSGVSTFSINYWNDRNDRAMISKYISRLCHPRFEGKGIESVYLTPASIVTGNELAIQIGLPKKSISGLTVIPMASFGRNVINRNEKIIEVGKMYHMGKVDSFKDGSVSLDVESLSMHTFITGSTGSGKSTMMYSILDKLMNTNVGLEKEKNEVKNIKFLVIEPTKGEYKDRFSNYDNVSVYGTNSNKTPLLRINPFSFPNDVHVLEHIDRLVEIFNVCWPMYAAMPAVLKDSIEMSYVSCGWNLTDSVCKYKSEDGINIFPTFSDVLSNVVKVINESMYSDENKGNYQGALCTRLKSLTNGIYGQIFTSDEIDSKSLFDENVIIDLSRVSSLETKSLLMGLLVIKLQEYRISNSEGSNEPLRHVTVLEEAHNILKRTSTEQVSEGSNIVGKSVEMLANSIAEMRTYGEGFFILDQAPNLLDMSVIRNTNTKVILRLPDLSDRKLVGSASSMSEEQIEELSRLSTFVAAIYQNDWTEPVLCKINSDFKDYGRYSDKYDKDLLSNDIKRDFVKKVKLLMLEYIFTPIDRRDDFDKDKLDFLKKNIYFMDISSMSKISFFKYIDSVDKDSIQIYRQRLCYDLFKFDEVYRFVDKSYLDTDCIRESIVDLLSPDIRFFDSNTQDKIVATLIKERADLSRSQRDIEMFNRFMDGK